MAGPQAQGIERRHFAGEKPVRVLIVVAPYYRAVADALLAAARPPAQLIPVGAELVGLCERMAEVATGALLADVAAAAEATAAGIGISRTNVEADIAPRRGNAEAERLAAGLDAVDDLLLRAARVCDVVRRALARG